MKAATLLAFGSPLSIGAVPDPVPGTGEVVVDVVATGVLPYTADVFSGARRYPLELPVVPGCGAVGRVRTTGPDATRLSPGDWVFCDPTVRSRDGGLAPDITLQGWSSRGEGGLRLQKYFHNGPFAERMMVPTENAIPLGVIDEADAGRWCAAGVALVPYGGLLATGLQAGETLLVSGATGNYGSAAVATALAMGAGCVVAPGRNERTLADLVRRFGSRVRPVTLAGNEDADRARMQAAASGPIDCVLDILPPSVSATVVRAAVMAVRPFGRAVLMGGVGMLGGDDLSLPYPWIMRNCVSIQGQWMFEPSAVFGIIALVRAGLLDLGQFEVSEFALDNANEAVAHAAAHAGSFRITVIRP
ncbi:zinc-binding alcohol dehydrogenase family protein [Lichenifustis flavocetrariae]|uniref:Zinc-binding alcohol dehydrogenase family protein n=1 Tax=Lichenifustis flavocetrariae TaxID=2949735 RepID=A0AA41Z4N5_9HYPH|nr:zinc-binding alcohol dehydrogenase family protein [Lichenifustis flavocetrariae]MCW6512735.1 zinc-binding alcohol dehydrogenase family protein [Lichenifustis flavocetrariae]